VALSARPLAATQPANERLELRRRIIRPRDRHRETWDDWDGLDSRGDWPDEGNTERTGPTIMPLSSGETFAGFRIVRPVGSGGMGEMSSERKAVRTLRPTRRHQPRRHGQPRERRQPQSGWQTKVCERLPGSGNSPWGVGYRCDMSAERGWIVAPRPNPHSVEAWAERHRRDGHHPYPAPTAENPERWECKCDPDAAWTAVWRILTLAQIRQKFAHLSSRPGEKDAT
jgi:hypothetical protein